MNNGLLVAQALLQVGEVQRAEEVMWQTAVNLLAGPVDEAVLIQLRALADTLLVDRRAGARAMAIRAVVAARLGRCEEVEGVIDYERALATRFLTAADLAGADLESFNRELAAEIRTFLVQHEAPEDRAIRYAADDDQVLNRRTPACQTLRALLSCEVRRRLDERVEHGEAPPFREGLDNFDLKGWAVVSGEAGYHTHHIHPRGRLSGVYYVAFPEAARQAGSRCGWLRFAPPETMGIMPKSGWTEHFVEPRPGLLVLFPPYFFHGTTPTGVAGERICVAFDVVPVRLRNTTSS